MDVKYIWTFYLAPTFNHKYNIRRFNRTNKPNKKRLIEASNQFVEGWTGVGIMVGIWVVTFGIVACGKLKL